jgi:hypothetical protein
MMTIFLFLSGYLMGVAGALTLKITQKVSDK